MKLRTAAEARAELQAKVFRSPNGRSPTSSPRTSSLKSWAVARSVRGQAHEIAIKLGLKAEICTDPAKALMPIRHRAAA
jgi:hypothetical protein